MLLKTRGIIFRAIKYSETSFITDIYTEEKGLRSYIVSGVRKKNATVSPSLLQLMTLVDLVVYHREDKTLARIKEIKAAQVFQSIPFDVVKGAVGLFMIEVARKTINESEENQGLFQFLFDTFSFLDHSTTPIGNIHLHFLLELTLHLGFFPGGQYSEATPFFDLQEGTFVAKSPAHTWFLNTEESQQLQYLLDCQRTTCHEVKLNRESRRQLLRQLLIFYRLHIENFPTINAHQILEEVL